MTFNPTTSLLRMRSLQNRRNWREIQNCITLSRLQFLQLQLHRANQRPIGNRSSAFSREFAQHRPRPLFAYLKYVSHLQQKLAYLSSCPSSYFECTCSCNYCHNPGSVYSGSKKGKLQKSVTNYKREITSYRKSLILSL